jgi:hypothetical protein
MKKEVIRIVGYSSSFDLNFSLHSTMDDKLTIEALKELKKGIEIWLEDIKNKKDDKKH